MVINNHSRHTFEYPKSKAEVCPKKVEHLDPGLDEFCYNRDTMIIRKKSFCRLIEGEGQGAVYHTPRFFGGGLTLYYDFNAAKLEGSSNAHDSIILNNKQFFRVLNTAGLYFNTDSGFIAHKNFRGLPDKAVIRRNIIRG